MVKSLILHLVLLSVCKVYSNTILDIQTEAPRPTRVVTLQSFSNTHVHTGHVVLQSVHFSVSVRQSVGYS